MNDFDDMTDEQVLLCYYNEDNDARADLVFAELDRRFRPRLLLSLTQPGYHRSFVKLYRRPGLEQLAEELVIEALFRVAQTRGKPSTRWVPGRSKVASWIFGILHNLTVSHLRRKKPPFVTDTDVSGGEASQEMGSLLESTPDSAPGPEDALERQALLQVLRQCLEELPPELRSICELLYQEGMKQSEIATVLGLSQPTLTRRKQEAVELLRQCLRSKGISEDVLG